MNTIAVLHLTGFAGIFLWWLGRRAHHDGMIGIGFLLTVVGFGVGGYLRYQHWMETPEARAERLYEEKFGPRTLKAALGDSVVNVIRTEDLTVMYSVKSVWSDETALTSFAVAFHDIGRWLMRNPEERVPKRNVVVQFLAQTYDKYGAERTTPAITISWSSDDVKRISWGSILTPFLLDLGTPRWIWPVMYSGGAAWCAEHLDEARNFCSRFASQVSSR